MESSSRPRSALVLWLRWLCGDGRAGVTLARRPETLLLCLPLLASAGFAREWDQEWLPGAPQLLALPAAASLVAAVVFWVLLRTAQSMAHYVRGTAKELDEEPPLVSSWTVLVLFWSTAPLAWLYGIPWERWWDPRTAVILNLGTLFLVATWRVWLITAATAVLCGTTRLRALAFTSAYGALTAMAVAVTIPAPVIDAMSGLIHTPEEALMDDVRAVLWWIGIVGVPCAAAGFAAATHLGWLGGHPPEPSSRRVSWWGAAVVALAAPVVWPLVVPLEQAQDAVHLREELRDTYLSDGPEALAERLAEVERTDLPPHWHPVPRVSRRENSDIARVLVHLEQIDPDSWAVGAYARHLLRALEVGSSDAYELSGVIAEHPDPERVLDLLGPQARDLRPSLHWHLEDAGADEDDDQSSD